MSRGFSEQASYENAFEKGYDEGYSDREKEYYREGKAMESIQIFSKDKLDEIAEKVLTGEIGCNEARVAADIIKWSASKKKPKKYGDKQQIDMTTKVTLADKSDKELEAMLDKLRNKE